MAYKEVYKDPILARIEEEEKAAKAAVNKKYRVGLNEPGSETQDTMEQTKEISKELYDKLEMLGIIDTSNVRKNNVGQSNYAEHTIQPWSIWLDYKDLTPWDADIIKRILRTKDDKSMTPEQQRTMDYNKIIHICRERIRQIQLKENQNKDKKIK